VIDQKNYRNMIENYAKSIENIHNI